MKKRFKKLFKSIIHYFKYNKQFCSYVILSIFCAIFVKIYTTGSSNISSYIFDISIPIVIGSFCYLLKPKKQVKYLFVLLLLLALICTINSIYYKFYASFASFSLLTAVNQIGKVGDAVFEKLRLIQFIFFLAPALFLIINRKLNNRDYFNYVTKIEKSKILFRNVFIFGIIILLIGVSTLDKTAYNRLSKQWNREYIINRFGISIYQINDLINTLKPTINSLFGYDIAYKEFVEYYETNQLPVSNNNYTNIYKDYNVIFVHMESVTSFLIDLNINGVEIAPNLKKLSDEGMYFTNFFPQIGVGTSSDTEFTLSTSLMPSINGTVFVSYPDRNYPSYQKLFQEKGYYTFSMHGNKASMWNRNIMHPNLGYMDFYSETSFEVDEVVGLGLSDKSFFKQAIPILENIENNNKKYMGTIITLSNHTPFDNNEIFDQIDLKYSTDNITYDYLEDTKLGDYIRSSHYSDQALGEFINYIKESPCFNKTVFVFYGDHDPKLSYDEFNNYYNFDPETGGVLEQDDENYINYDYYDNELNKKTPLIIWTKNKKIAKKINYYMGMIDVGPTIGNMVGIYNEYALGHDIFEIKNNNLIVFPNGNYLTNKVFYRSSKEEYKILKDDEILSDDYIKDMKDKADKIIDISDGIIVHDLIKASQNKKNNQEIK